MTDIFQDLLSDVPSSIEAGAEVSRIIVAILQIKDLRVIRFLDACCPVDPLFNFHAEADIVDSVDPQR
jgi:hypothetical protein